MSKVDPIPTSPFSPTTYVTGDQIVAHYGGTTVAVLPTAEQQRYTNYAALSNKQTETVIYKYIDTIPLAVTDELRTYAEGMALYYAIWLKQIDDGAPNVAAMKDIWETYKAQIIEVSKAQPKSSQTRRMVSNGFPDSVIPYSQTGGGLTDIL